MVLIGLALFLTFFVMQPVLERCLDHGAAAAHRGPRRRTRGAAARHRAVPPLHDRQSAAADLQLFLDIAHLPAPAAPDDAPWRALVPAFLVGELRRAFEMGFLLFLPFMVIDMVVASVLMSLGMMMLPPSVVSLPFKLIFFVLVDGWRLVSGSLVQSFNGTGP